MASPGDRDLTDTQAQRLTRTDSPAAHSAVAMRFNPDKGYKLLLIQISVAARLTAAG